MSDVARELARIRRLGEPPQRLSGRILAALAVVHEATSSELAIRLEAVHGSVQEVLADLVRQGRVARRRRGNELVYRAA